MNTPRQGKLAQSLGQNQGCPLRRVIAGAETPHLWISPSLGCTATCIVLGKHPFPHQPQQMAMESAASRNFPRPLHRQSLAGLKRKQMFSSFLGLACDLQFSSVQT